MIISASDQLLLSWPMLRMLCAALTLICCQSGIGSSLAADISAPGLHVKAYDQDPEGTSAYWPTDPVKCDLVLSGDIAEGDQAALQTALEPMLERFNSFTFFLCLRSNGGNLQEALRIAKYVRETQRPSIATVVEDGQTCASACALVFLAGNAPMRVGARPNRFLHPRARLLYHSARLELDNFSDDALLNFLTEPRKDKKSVKERVESLYAGGLRDFQAVLDTFKGNTFQREDIGDPWVRQSLFLEMFAQDPNEWICVDTVDAVGRWNVQVFGFDPPRTPTKTHYENICRNAYHWRADSFVNNGDEPAISEFLNIERLKKHRNRDGSEAPGKITLLMQAPLAQISCKITGAPAEGEKIDESTDTSVAFEGYETSRSELFGSIGYFPADTYLAELPSARNASSTGKPSPRGFAMRPNSVMPGCSHRRLTTKSIENCASECAADERCKAYSFKATSSGCELKHTITALRIDPLYVTGVPENDNVSRSSRQAKVDSDIHNSFVAGSIMDEKIESDTDSCARWCEAETECLAVEFRLDSNLCRRFSVVDMIVAAEQEEITNTVVRLKRQ